jgi:hypothetical protein
MGILSDRRYEKRRAELARKQQLDDVKAELAVQAKALLADLRDDLLEVSPKPLLQCNENVIEITRENRKFIIEVQGAGVFVVKIPTIDQRGFLAIEHANALVRNEDEMLDDLLDWIEVE